MSLGGLACAIWQSACVCGAFCLMLPYSRNGNPIYCYQRSLSTVLYSYTFDYAAPIVTKRDRSERMRSESEQTSFFQPGGARLAARANINHLLSQRHPFPPGHRARAHVRRARIRFPRPARIAGTQDLPRLQSCGEWGLKLMAARSTSELPQSQSVSSAFVKRMAFPPQAPEPPSPWPMKHSLKRRPRHLHTFSALFLLQSF